MTTDTADTVTARQKPSAKDDVRALLDRLPEDVTLEDIQYHLDVVVKVLEAEASDPRNDIPHEEFVRRLQERWGDAATVDSEGFTHEDFERRFGEKPVDR